MKILSILLIVLLVILALLGFGLQRFLTEGLTVALNEQIFPAVESEYGVKVSVTNASVNLFKGRAELQGLHVSNLEGYEEPHLLTAEKLLLQLDLLSLLKRDPITIRLIEAKGAMLVIERNKKSKINIKEIADALAPTEKEGEEELTESPSTEMPESPSDTISKKSPALPIHIRRIAFDLTVLYADSKTKETYTLSLQLKGSDLFTLPAAGQPDSFLILRGTLAEDDRSCVIDMNARVEPLIDRATPSFKASGSILDIEAKVLEDLLEKNNMSSGPFSIKPSITCSQRSLEKSKIEITLQDLNFSGTDLGKTTLNLPIGGTLDRPTLDLTSALQSLFSKNPSNILKLLSSQKSESRSKQKKNSDPIDTTKIPAEELTADSLRQTLNEVLSEQIDENVKDSKDNKTLKHLTESLFGK